MLAGLGGPMSPSDPPEPALLVAAGSCAAADALLAPHLKLAGPSSDFILCTCDFCGEHPEAVCRISPSGYSTICSYWYAANC